MEVLVFLFFHVVVSSLLGCVVWLVIWLQAKSQSRVKATTAKHLAESMFRVSVAEETKTFQSDSLKVFQVKIRGVINAPHNDYPIRNSVTAFDITDGEYNPQPILCMIEQLQLPGTIAFGYSSPKSRLPYANSIMKNWVDMLSIPVDAMVFPKKGAREVKFSFVVASAVNDRQLAEADCAIKYTNLEFGYLDLKARREKTEILTVQLAIAVSAADGSLDKSEGRVVQDWVKKRITTASRDDQPVVKSRLNNAVTDAVQRFERDRNLRVKVKNDQGVEYGPIDIKMLIQWVEEKRVVGETLVSEDDGEQWRSLDEMSHLFDPIWDDLSVDNICSEMREVSSRVELYEALELCLKVARADEVASDTELDLLNDLAGKLGVDKDRFRAMTDKILPVAMQEVVDADRLLGLGPDMTESQQREHLRREYKRWNARVTHSDANVRKQAEEMLDLIAKTRNKLGN